MNTINPSLLLSQYQKDKQRNTGSDAMGKDAFLRILMTQLQNQDPLNPMQDKDFVAQMATFSTLEQITNMGKSIDNFVSMGKQNQLISYNQFMGKQVSWHKVSPSDDSTAEPTIEQGQGTISSLEFKDDSVYFILEDGTKLEPGNISQVNQPTAGNNLFSASELIGKKVTWLNGDNKEIEAIVKSVQMKDGKTEFLLDDEDSTKLASSKIIKIAAS
ncbi:flagellar hook assembly protein FlgD [Peribacillus sp. SCS-155]|uniref:flagellar hook assembly protein FlgD n=1 Tax=Peribacillus sedimenti TaxID=3115297 RepID=UPI0039065B10